MPALNMVAPRLVLGLSDRLLGLSTLLQLARLARESRPILVGPWLSEVGYELLYWIPFLRWAVNSARFDPAHLVVVSRGGVADWYRDISSRYVDLFDLFTLDEFRRLNEQRIQAQGEIKHWGISPADREIARRVGDGIGASSLAQLHPSLMYRCLQFYWLGRAGRRYLERHTSYQAQPKPVDPRVELALPSSYVAAKFYFNASFPETPANRDFVASILRALAADSEVVLLNTGLVVDDHSEHGQPNAGRLFTLDQAVTPRNNLELQTRVLADAQAFVGTYGGFSYLAPLLGVDSLTFYSEPGELNPAHLELARQVLPRLEDAAFQVLHVTDVERLRSLLGRPAELASGGVRPLREVRS